MKDVTIDLFDSDNNHVLVLVRYNEQYLSDYSVLAAQVMVGGNEIRLDNLRMIEAQYATDIQREIRRITQ